MEKVLIVDNSVDTTGAFNAILSNCLHLKANIEFLFILPKHSKNIDKLKFSGFPYIEFNFVEISKRPFDLIFYLPALLLNGYKLSRIIKKKKVSIVHVNDLYNLVGFVGKLFVKFKLVTHIRRMPESFPLILYKFWVFIHSNFSDVILPVSKANKEIFKRRNNIHVIYDNLPKDETLPDYQPIDRKIKKLLCLANFNLGKGQNHALEAIKQLYHESLNFNFSLTFVGGDFGVNKNIMYRKHLTEIVSINGLGDFVHFDNKSDHVEKTMKDFDIVLNLSDSESFSRVSLEALFYGIPLIATDVGGTNEMFEHGKSGILVGKGNISEIKSAIKILVNDLNKRIEFSKAGKIFVKEHFGINETSYKIMKVYNEF